LPWSLLHMRVYLRMQTSIVLLCMVIIDNNDSGFTGILGIA
jgi:hypothetical protein